MKANYLLAYLLFFLLSACAKSMDLSLSDSAEHDYKIAERLVAEEKYARAAEYLGNFMSKHPYSAYTTPAELLRIKAAYLNGEFILSETLSTRFIDAHPEHPKRDYAEYILGMSYYHQSESEFHEQVFSNKARNTFIALNKRKPNHAYAKETKKYIRLLTNRIAKHELLIGKFYFERKLYVGAINRFIVVKNDFPDAEVAAESLYWLASAYLSLAQRTYAKEVVTTLNHRFPHTIWQKKAAQLQ